MSSMGSVLIAFAAERPFADTNIFVYAFDRSAPGKCARAQALIGHPFPRGMAISTQVVQEFYSVLSRKLSPPLHAVDIDVAIEALLDLDVEPVSVSLIRQAIARHRQNALSFWDALIVEAAVASGADVLYSEDFQHGQRFGALTVVNPFLAEA